MKNRNKNIGIAFCLGMVVLAAFAFDIVPESQVMARKIVVKETGESGMLNALDSRLLGEGEFKCFDVTGLPKAIKSAVISKFIAYSVDEVFLKGDGNYKLILKNGNSRLIAYYHADGEYLRHETVKPVQMVALY